MVNYPLRWCSTLNRIFDQFLFGNTLKQNLRTLEAVNLYPGCHTHQLLRQRPARILSLWLHLVQQNGHGLHLQLQRGITQDIQFPPRPFQSLTTMTCMLLQPIRRLFLYDRRIPAPKTPMQPPCHMTIPMKNLQPRLQLHRKLLLQHLVLVTLSEDGHRLMIQNSSASNRTPEPDTLGRPLVNVFIGTLTAAKHAGTG